MPKTAKLDYVVPAVKRCGDCGVTKPTFEFYKHRTRGFQNRCKACNKSWKARNARRKSYYENGGYERHIARKFGVDRQVVHSILTNWDGKCECCGEDTKPNFDHCHTTGVIRGLLCNDCNAGIGHFKEDLARLKLAMKYLSSARQVIRRYR